MLELTFYHKFSERVKQKVVSKRPKMTKNDRKYMYIFNVNDFNIDI